MGVCGKVMKYKSGDTPKSHAVCYAMFKNLACILWGIVSSERLMAIELFNSLWKYHHNCYRRMNWDGR